MLDIAEEFMYELVPKALFYYLNLEEVNPPIAESEERLKYSDRDVEETKGEGDKQGTSSEGENDEEVKAGEEGEEDEVEDENKGEEAHRPTCLLQ